MRIARRLLPVLLLLFLAATVALASVSSVTPAEEANLDLDGLEMDDAAWENEGELFHSTNETQADALCTLGGLGGCATSKAAGLKNQIAAELNSMGYKFVGVNSQWIRCSGCKMQGVAHNALVAAAKAKKDFITLNSAWRASSDQYLLYKWYQSRQCGIQLAAKPGTSNHEGGLAIDTSYYSYWRSTLEQHGWRWLGSKDTVHFDYIKGGADLRKKNLQAFQRLWNRKNPKNKIAEDGIYGPATQSALSRSPCNGW